MIWCIAAVVVGFIVGFFIAAKLVTYLCNEHVAVLYRQQGYRMGSFGNGAEDERKRDLSRCWDGCLWYSRVWLHPLAIQPEDKAHS